MTLELSILTDQKVSKLIELVEKQRQDNPLLEDRPDPAAEALAEPSDPEAVLEAIRKAQREIEDAQNSTVMKRRLFKARVSGLCLL
jgi:uncharacterized membrane protein